jgi:hypothetical protein
MPPMPAWPASAHRRINENTTPESRHGYGAAVAGLSGEHGEGRNRTGDTTVFSRVLYQLSYLAAGRLV